MEQNFSHANPSRRKFIGSVTAAIGLTAIVPASSMDVQANAIDQEVADLESWFSSMKGKHRMVFDAVTVNEGYSVIWSYTFMTTNNQTGTPDAEVNALVVLRSKAIALALENTIWDKYKLGKMFKIADPSTNVPADRNIYWDPKEGEMPVVGMSIKALLARGAMFCVCDTALTMTARQYAKGKGLEPEEVKKEWVAGIIPGIQLVPSGVWAVNRAQENGCSYCSAG